MRHVRVAADRLAAVAVVGQQLGLVADADLPHLDARLVLAGQVLDQLAEIDALLGQEVEDDPLAAEQVLDVHQFHLQMALADEALAGRQFVGLDGVQSIQCGLVLVGQPAQDAAVRRLGQQLHGPRVGLAQHLRRPPVPDRSAR